MEGSGHSAATATPLQGVEVAARSLLLGMPAWSFALLGLLAGLLVTGAMVLLERGNLQGEARLQDSQVALVSFDIAKVFNAFAFEPLQFRVLVDEIAND